MEKRWLTDGLFRVYVHHQRPAWGWARLSYRRSFTNEGLMLSCMVAKNTLLQAPIGMVGWLARCGFGPCHVGNYSLLNGENKWIFAGILFLEEQQGSARDLLYPWSEGVRLNTEIGRSLPQPTKIYRNSWKRSLPTKIDVISPLFNIGNMLKPSFLLDRK